jgi:transposase
MIRIQTVWLALGASDLRGGIDRLLAMVVHGFASGAQAHHAYVFANRRADRLKVLVYDGAGMWAVHPAPAGRQLRLAARGS